MLPGRTNLNEVMVVVVVVGVLYLFPLLVYLLLPKQGSSTSRED